MARNAPRSPVLEMANAAPPQIRGAIRVALPRLRVERKGRNGWAEFAAGGCAHIWMHLSS